MKPTIGRIVHYWPRKSAGADNGLPMVYAVAAEPVPAIIVRVWSDDCVNLRVFNDAEPRYDAEAQEHVTSVTRCDQGDTWGWDWPARD